MERLSHWDRKKHDCQGAFRVYWIAESRPGDTYPPGVGELRLTFEGKQYNAVTNATSRKPLTPDLTIYDLGKFEEEHPGALKFPGPKPRSGARAVVFEVLLWGPAVPTWRKGTAELEVGVLEAGITGTPEKVRWEWVRFALPATGGQRR